MVTHDSDSKQAQISPGTTAATPGTTPAGPGMVPPPAPGTAKFDHALSAVIDHLMVVQDHQLTIQDNEVEIDAALAIVCSLVEGLLP